MSRENGGDEPAATPNVYAAGSYFNAFDDAFSTAREKRLWGMLKHVDEIAAASGAWTISWPLGDRREVIHAGPDKVHFDTRFISYDQGGEVIGGFDSMW